MSEIAAVRRAAPALPGKFGLLTPTMVTSTAQVASRPPQMWYALIPDAISGWPVTPGNLTQDGDARPGWVSDQQYSAAMARPLRTGVREAVSYGIPDTKYGQLVGAAVVPSGETTESELIAYCSEKLAAFKVPSVIHVVETIPRTPTGKVQRPRMAAHFGED